MQYSTTRCPSHGGFQIEGAPTCQTDQVLADVRAERARQFAQYGTNEDLELGMGPTVRWLAPYTPHDALHVERTLRQDYEDKERFHGKPTWMSLIREEVAEAFSEGDPAKLRAELLQVAALAVSAVEKMDARAAEAARQAEEDRLAGLSMAEVMARVTGSVGATVVEQRVMPDGSVVETARSEYGDVR